MLRNGIAVRKGKTKTALWIPFTPRLREYLAQLPFRNLTIVAGPKGAPVNYHSAAAPIRALRAQIGALTFTIHGWRYTAASQLAAAGASDEEVQAITGHKSRAMVMKYAGAERQPARATSGQAKR